MRSSRKPWVLVHYKKLTTPPAPSGVGLAGWGFAVFSSDNWRRYTESLPAQGGLLFAIQERLGEIPKGFSSKRDYLEHLQVTFLTDFEFRQLCKTVLNVSPGVLRLRLGQMREDDRRPVAKYGVFPEYEFPTTKGRVRG